MYIALKGKTFVAESIVDQNCMEISCFWTSHNFLFPLFPVTRTKSSNLGLNVNLNYLSLLNVQTDVLVTLSFFLNLQKKKKKNIVVEYQFVYLVPLKYLLCNYRLDSE